MEEKSNVCKVQKSLGAYRFRIEGYSGLSQKVGDSVESPEFNICGHTWQLRIFPGGSLEAHKGYVSFYLASKSTLLARASYKLIVVNQIPGGEDETFSSSGIRVFEPKGVQVDGWGRDKFMIGTMLQDSELGFCVDDAVTFRVELTVFGDLQSTQIPSTTDDVMLIKNYALDNCLKKMLQDSAGTDVAIIAGETKTRIDAHKCILMARSPVFYAMFSYNMSESVTNEVVIPDILPDVLKEMLHFMYTDSCTSDQISGDISIPLLTAALKYQIPGLVDVCETYFATQLTEDTAVDLLQMADTYGATNLKQKALQYISQHSKLATSAQYQQLDENLLREACVVIEAAHKRSRLVNKSTDRDSTKRLPGFCVIM